VEAEIKPDPTPEERAAILAALGRLVSEAPPAYRSAWRQLGVEENLEEDGSEPE